MITTMIRTLSVLLCVDVSKMPFRVIQREMYYSLSEVKTETLFIINFLTNIFFQASIDQQCIYFVLKSETSISDVCGAWNLKANISGLNFSYRFLTKVEYNFKKKKLRKSSRTFRKQFHLQSKFQLAGETWSRSNSKNFCKKNIKEPN